MSTISIRLPDSLHNALRDLAKRENTSINHLITLATAEKVAALMTEEYLTERGRNASRAMFDAVLAKVPSVDPEPDDA